ncbi:MULTISPECIES: YscO family type III secretion system apparatus protein [Pseudomonas]|uniref:type III secretion system stalk subunit SctO n=1 Tax=Pseudomonas TaxID=286 RepID=UPI000CFA922F|nr:MULTISPECIES: YscO family type III secretion system apparatus protein [Pseudomonas]PQZ86637.1 type III secretion protein [Pseudomonas trivialis]PRB23041.1 type III secretion protein [Pseudomonas sp. MYb60]
MSLSEGLLGEIEILRRLRRHRADRAERALREAKRAQQTLFADIRQAEDALEQSRQEEVRQSADLLGQHTGQVLSLKELKSWGSKERALSASTQREAGQLQTLQGQQEEKQRHVGRAQKDVTACLRQVEKLQELSQLLVEEPL